MTLTKSFGYALRSILYIAVNSQERPKVKVDEIATRLSVPKYFLGKIMKMVVKNGLLNSTKGPYGGFSLNDRTLSTSLLELATLTNSLTHFDDCVLRLNKCNASSPCPLHSRIATYKKDLHTLFSKTQIGDLLDKDIPDYIKSIQTQ